MRPMKLPKLLETIQNARIEATSSLLVVTLNIREVKVKDEPPRRWHHLLDVGIGNMEALYDYQYQVV